MTESYNSPQRKKRRHRRHWGKKRRRPAWVVELLTKQKQQLEEVQND